MIAIKLKQSRSSRLDRCTSILSIVSAVVLGIACSEQIEPPVVEEPVDNCANPMLTDAPVDVTQYVATAEDFGCMQTDGTASNAETEWYAVRNFLIKNQAGRTQEALDVACGRKPTPYPIGTIVQLIPFEAMVKRGGDYAPDANGWEFFALDSEETDTGDVVTTIVNRGNTDTTNFADANCFDCHRKARPEFDMLCEQTNGCDPLGVPGSVIKSFQETDARCE